MTDRELMQRALDALEGYVRNCRCEGGGGTTDAAEALRARLAQPEPEPVAWMHDSHVGFNVPLYTAPPQREWQGLTDDEIMDACSAVWASHPIEVGQVVAAILKEKNGF